MFRPAIEKVLPGYHQIISIKILTFKPHFARLPGNFNYEFRLTNLKPFAPDLFENEDDIG